MDERPSFVGVLGVLLGFLIGVASVIVRRQEYFVVNSFVPPMLAVAGAGLILASHSRANLEWKALTAGGPLIKRYNILISLGLAAVAFASLVLGFGLLYSLVRPGSVILFTVAGAAFAFGVIALGIGAVVERLRPKRTDRSGNF